MEDYKKTNKTTKKKPEHVKHTHKLKKEEKIS
jgi:hypothetical protein